MTVDRCPQTLWDEHEHQCQLPAGHPDGHLYDIRRDRDTARAAARLREKAS